MIRTQAWKLGVDRKSWAWSCTCWVLTAACVAGCAHRPQCNDLRTVNAPQNASTAASFEPFAEVLPEIARGAIVPDVSLVGAYTELSSPGTLPNSATRYHSLTAEECRRKASEKAVLANQLSREAQSVADGRCATAHAASLRRELLSLRASDERNRAAGAALELFYRLAEAEAGRDTVHRGLTHIDSARGDIEQIRDKGLPIDVDASALSRQRIVWLQKREEIARSLGEVNGQLCHLVGLPSETSTPLWPVADLRVTQPSINVDNAIAQALITRADLALLRRLDGSLDIDTLPAARGALVQVDPMLGQSGMPARLLARALGSHADACEIPHRREQVRMLLADREREITEEVRQAASTVESRYRDIALAKEYATSWRGRLDDLRQRRNAGKISPFEISAAEVELVQAESALTSRVIDWKVADVKLLQAQGVLGP